MFSVDGDYMMLKKFHNAFVKFYIFCCSAGATYEHFEEDRNHSQEVTLHVFKQPRKHLQSRSLNKEEEMLSDNKHPVFTVFKFLPSGYRFGYPTSKNYIVIIFLKIKSLNSNTSNLYIIFYSCCCC